MRKSIAFIDCFIETPANICFNEYASYSREFCSYHMPSMYGFDSLKKLAKADAFIILGSASHVSEKLDWHQGLLDFIIPKLESGKAVLGICFGHQLLADYYGCQIDYIDSHREVIQEIRKTKITKSELGYTPNKNLNLVYSHAQVVKEVSDQMIPFACSKVSKFEALRHVHYPLWTVQSHPEASTHFMKKFRSQSSHDGLKLIDNFIKNIS